MPILQTELTGQKMPLPGDAEYKARVLNITVQEKANPTPEEVEKGDTSYLRWEFVTTDDNGEHSGVKLSGNSSFKFGARSKARAWSSALMGRKLAADEAVDTDTLIGLEGLLYITEDRKSDGRVYAKIEEINRA